jgi:type IV pilus assembly protein PilW
MRGLSLIELMVSLAIGLVLMVAVVSAYLGSVGASRVAEAQGRMNEDAQAALSILTQQLRMAGTNPKQPDYANDTPRNPVYAAPGGGAVAAYAIRGCDTKFSNVTTAADISTLTCDAGSGTDSVAISYEADPYNTIKNSSDAATDCLGQALPVVTNPYLPGTPVKYWNGTALVSDTAGAKTYTVAESRFYIDTATGVGPSLYCKGNGGTTPQPLVENIENLQIKYGMQDDPADPVNVKLGGYVTATELEAVTLVNLAPSNSLNKWSKVVTARVCVIVRSAHPVVPDVASASYYDCEGVLVDSSTDPTVEDLRLRRAYSTTVVLRNRVGS